jgi:hypothetical protein
LVYVLEIPLLSSTTYQLYKLIPFPVLVKQEESTYSYIVSSKELIFSDPLRQHYGKMTSNELTGCFHPNDISYVCKEDIPIHTYIPETDCESTLLHPSTMKVPYNCEYRFLKLKQTLWIPLHLSNEWLYAAPESETLTVLCPEETTTLKIQAKCTLTLKPGCKGYSSYVTLYAMSSITTNLTTDYIPSAPVDFDCCF